MGRKMKRQLDTLMERYTKAVRITSGLRAAVSQLEEALDMLINDQDLLEEKINQLLEDEK